MLQLSNLKGPTRGRKNRKRIGRGIGSGTGKTSGKGQKGQNSRSGGRMPPWFEGGQMPLQMRLPKYGFSSRIGLVTAEVRTSELNKVDGDIVTMESLRKAGIITTSIKKVKVMLSGEVTKKLTVEGISVSKGGKEAIEKAGGKVIEIGAAEKKKSNTKSRAKVADSSIDEANDDKGK